jgi:hypothetical protein
MGPCSHCGTLVLFGGKRSGGLQFCSEACLRLGTSSSAAQQLAQEVPDELVQQQVLAVHQGVCPKCGREGPVDIHASHRVWSAIHMTSWNSRQQVCCRACAVKAKCGDALFSLLFGWWGFPFGLVITPLQIGRNIAGILRGPDPTAPSPQLERMVRADITRRAAMIQATVEQEQQAGQRGGQN